MTSSFAPRHLCESHSQPRVCPACRGPLAERAQDMACEGCDRVFPTVAGLPDLRLASDRYLSLEEERAKAERLARYEAETDVLGLAESYYAMTADVDPPRRARYLSHIARAEDRGEALAALLPSGGRVLEVGCGSGGLLVAAARAGWKIEGADIALRWLVIARRRLADRGLVVPLVGASADRLPWPDGHFDAVVADSLLEHLSDPAPALREWHRVVRPGGRLLVWSPNRFTLLADPHVGLWGVGWMPRLWATAYVRLRKGCDWPVLPMSAVEARRLAVPAGWSGVDIEAPEIPVRWARSRPERLALRAYSVARRSRTLRGLVRRFGPLWQLVATNEEAA